MMVCSESPNEKRISRRSKVLDIVRRVALASLCMLLAAGLMGCRTSHKLEKVRFTESADQVQEDQEQIHQDTDGRMEEFLRNLQQQEALSEVDEEFIAQYVANLPEDYLSADATFNSAAAEIPTNDSPIKGNSGSGDINQGEVGTEIDSEGSVGVPGSGNGNVSGSGDGEGTGSKDPGESGNPTDNPDEESIAILPVQRPGLSSKTFFDNAGEETELPVRANKVAATGNIAQIVEMVGGSNRLVGTDAVLLSNPVAQQVFADYGTLRQWWSDDGSNPISQQGLKELLENPEIDVVFEEKGKNTFSVNQVQQLRDAGVAYVSLKPFTDIQGLCDNIRAVAHVLDNSEYSTDSAAKAQAYIDWCNNVFADVKGKVGASDKLTCFIAGWDDTASYALSGGTAFIPEGASAAFGLPGGQGNGLAYGITMNHPSLFTEAANRAAVYNTTSNYNITWSDPNAEYGYVAPVFQIYDIIGGGLQLSGACAWAQGSKAPAYVEHLSRRNGVGGYIVLGQTSFPGIIVKDSATLEKMKADVFWNYKGYGGLYWNNIPLFSTYVNPYGLTNWSEGSVESPLETVWIAQKIQGAYSTTALKGYVSDFYYQFFNTRLSDEMISSILSGR